MYARHVRRQPTYVNRHRFARELFSFSLYKNHGYDNILSALHLADDFLRLTRRPGKYSMELAYVVVCLIGKAWEENCTLSEALTHTGNGYVVDLEWEICLTLNFHFPRYNLMTVCHDICGEQYDNSGVLKTWGRSFHYLIKTLMRNPQMVDIPPQTILLGAKLLHRRGKLKCVLQPQRRSLLCLISRISREYELDYGAVITTFTQLCRGELVVEELPEVEPEPKVAPMPIMIPIRI